MFLFLRERTFGMEFVDEAYAVRRGSPDLISWTRIGLQWWVLKKGNKRPLNSLPVYIHII